MHSIHYSTQDAEPRAYSNQLSIRDSITSTTNVKNKECWCQASLLNHYVARTPTHCGSLNYQHSAVCKKNCWYATTYTIIAACWTLPENEELTEVSVDMYHI